MKFYSSNTRIESIGDLHPGNQIVHTTDFALDTYHYDIIVDVTEDQPKVKVVRLNPPPGTIRESIAAWLDNEVFYADIAEMCDESDNFPAFQQEAAGDGASKSRSIITDNVPLPEWIRTMKFYSSNTRIESIGDLHPGDQILHTTEFGLGTYHHAIVVDVTKDQSKVKVVHLNPPPGTIRQGIAAWMDNEVRIRQDEVDLARFLKDETLHRVDYVYPDRCFTREEVIARATRKIGRRRVSRSVEDGYDLLTNNCEHIATWFKTGHAFSVQSGKLQIKDDDTDDDNDGNDDNDDNDDNGDNDDNDDNEDGLNLLS